MLGPDRIEVLDISRFDRAEIHGAIMDDLAAHMEQTKHEHTLDLTPYDVERDKADVYREQKRKFGRRILKRIMIGVGILLLVPIAAGSLAVLEVAVDRRTGPAGADYWIIDRFQGHLTNLTAAMSEFGLIFFFGAILFFVIWHTAEFFTIRARVLAPRAKEVLATDKRCPVLLIRSFLDDEAPIYRVVAKSAPKGGVMWSIEESRFEEAFAPELSKYGPLIAVGNPSDELPDLGAARARFSDATWREPVLAMIEQSRVIVLTAGMKPATPAEQAACLSCGDLLALLDLTPGVRWEVEHILGKDLQNKMLVLFKPRRLSWFDSFMVLTGIAQTIDFLKWLFGRNQRPAAVKLSQALVLHMARDGRVVVAQADKRLDTADDYQCALRLAIHRMLVGQSASKPLPG